MSRNDDDERAWYFTFGGNMERATLAQRENITPRTSLPGTLEDFQLAFNTQGFENCEPRFASVVRLAAGSSSICVHGIAHDLSMREIRILDKYEGATGPPGATIGYNRVGATFSPYESAADAAPASQFEVQIYVATSARLVEPAPPSQRYLDLLLRGAVGIGLNEIYINWLRSHTTFSPDGMTMPEVPQNARLRVIRLNELGAHTYGADAATDGGAWVAIGGQCYDVSTLALEKAMIRNMTGKDGTAFVLRMRDAAYCDGVPTALSDLSDGQWAYVASWARYLTACDCPCIGVMAPGSDS